ncbi:MAG: aspartate-semialdehyde dehydrogenase [Lentisphaerae bacterium]|jgi:aspartate-semialdehyde dehydrogenase|nr:aspartate-semialdehyde dehydrogenase [Lentisphaerota bacterium]
MNRKYTVAIAGATGAVGAEMLKVLEERNFPVASLKLLASARSAGKKIKFCGEDVTVEELRHDSFNGVDIALFSAGGSLSKEFRDSVVSSGTLMIDNSSAFRMDDDVPLIIPEVNAHDMKKHKGVIANPNCSTIIMLIAVAPLHRKFEIRRIVASTYQAASGAGAKGMEELISQSRAVLDGETAVPSVFVHPIAFNLIPQIDTFLDNGYTREEMKMVYESRKILGCQELMVSCTCVRVPVVRAHSIALNLEFETGASPDMVREVLAESQGVEIVDDPSAHKYPMPLDASDKVNIFAGRIRQDISLPDSKGIDMFISGDQVIKGAALNTVQIAELALSSEQ